MNSAVSRGGAPRGGFTLMEVMISVTIGLLLVVLATTAFLRLERLVRRTQARLDMHGTMRFVQANLAQDVSASQGTCALFLTSQPSTAAASEPANARVSLVFMRGRSDPQDFVLTYLDNGAHFTDASDLTWVEWRWDQRRRQLLRGVNKVYRQFTANRQPSGPLANPLTFGTAYDYTDRRFFQQPQPRREWAGGPDAVLNQNSWNTGHPDDLGDRQELERNLAPVAANVTACTFQLVPQDGSTPKSADGTEPTGVNTGWDGAFVDGTGMPTDRPALVRVRIEMTDPATGLVQTFSWSVQAPGPQPPLALP